METKLTPWNITWDNDTGPNDDCYAEWFTVSNGIVEYECDTQEDAEELVKTLTEHSLLLQQRDGLIKASENALTELLQFYNFDITKAPEWLKKLNESINNIQKHQI